MRNWIFATRRRRRIGVGVFFGMLLLGLCGCKTLTFYSQAVRGQYQIIALQEPITELLQDASTSEQLRQRFLLLQQLRAFAEHQLALPVDGHYLKYADLKRPFVVWNVEAAPEFSMEPKGWWYPFVGKLEYRGFFNEKQARDYAEWLKGRGYDVQVGGVTAYSTLGWFKDPVLNTFIFDPSPIFAETIFHELAHQRLFAGGDKDFNEGYATFVGREGVRQWLRSQTNFARLDEYNLFLKREDEFAALVTKTKTKLEKLYGDEMTEEGKVRAGKFTPGALSPTELRSEKQRIFTQMQAEYREFSRDWDKDASKDWWFSRPLNNARINSVAAYHDFVPGFEKLFEANGGRLTDFHREAERLAKMDKKERHSWLRALTQTDSSTNSPPKL